MDLLFASSLLVLNLITNLLLRLKFTEIFNLVDEMYKILAKNWLSQMKIFNLTMIYLNGTLTLLNIALEKKIDISSLKYFDLIKQSINGLIFFDLSMAYKKISELTLNKIGSIIND